MMPNPDPNHVILTGFSNVKADISVCNGGKDKHHQNCGGIANEAFTHDCGCADDSCKRSVCNSAVCVKQRETDSDITAGVVHIDVIVAGNSGIGCDIKSKCKELANFREDQGVKNVDDATSETPVSPQNIGNVKTSLKNCVTGTNFLVYVSHFLSAWGDRMWHFGIGLFLVNIASENLQLPAVFGLSESLTIFFLGALVGDWVDSTPRLKAAQLSLILQNVFVVICAAGVYSYIWFEFEITVVHGEWLVRLCHAGIIIMGILASLSSLARMIAVERDWIVEICGKDKDMLAKMTASLRRIDQGTLILAPICTGQIMTYAGLKNGAIFIAAWNVGSVFIEYYLMWKVYNTVPALRDKKELCRADEKKAAKAEEENIAEEKRETSNDILSNEGNEATPLDSGKSDETDPDVVSAGAHKLEGEDIVMDPVNEEEVRAEETAVVVKHGKKNEKKGGCADALVCSRFVALYRGWKTYMRYSVMLAGLALSCLYMTVLGFDNITVAFAVTQGVSESILGILMGASAIFGILGTFAYPVLRGRLGLVRTGIFALSCQVLSLLPCVVSVWMPGSPFDPFFYTNPPTPPPPCGNTTGVQPSVAPALVSGNLSAGVYNISGSVTVPSIGNSTEKGSGLECGSEGAFPDSYLSVGLLMAGIVVARFGLWVADLTITQLFLEVVIEGERGVVNGVQSSLNKLMDVLKFVLVVAVPDIETFGYLIIISFSFICLGWLLYAIFLRRNRGHFFHFDKCVDDGGGDGDTPNGHAISDAA